jgi:3-oxoacyl-[acyl-carrier protein] reductase
MSINTERFTGKVAIVTGAAEGMGKQVSLDLASEGATVVVSDIQEAALQEVEAEITRKQGRCLAVVCDMASRQQVDNLIQNAVDSFGKIDILVNNAGVLITGSIEETTDQIIDKTLDVNVKGVLYAIRAVTPVMKRQKYGRIVNVASITGKNGDSTTVFAYGASKGGVISLTRSTARQLGPYGITANAIAPHAVLTRMMSYWDDSKKKSMAEKIPLRRLGTVEDISHLIRFLASDESSFITGETVNINGGYYMD